MNLYSEGFHGNQYTGIAADLGAVGKALGPVGFGAGIALDTYGVASGQESIGKAAVNTFMGATAFDVPVGTAAAAAYAATSFIPLEPQLFEPISGAMLPNAGQQSPLGGEGGGW